MTVPTLLPSNVRDDFGEVIKMIFAFFLIVIYIPPLYRTVYRIVQEKESRVKECMKIMGLGDAAYWFSWFTYFTLVNTVITFLTWFMLNGLWKGLRLIHFPLPKTIEVMGNTNDFVLLGTLFVYGQSIFGIILITQSLFENARAAAITTSIVYFGSSIFFVLVEEPTTPEWLQLVCSLSPTVAMIKTFTVVAAFEGSRVGSDFRNIYSKVGGYSVATGFKMLCIDSVLFYMIGIYLDQVLPDNFGRRKHPLFCCMRKSQQRNVQKRISRVYQKDDP
jgi:ATP-binding cassette subfamily A (ABC1) protein 3